MQKQLRFLLWVACGALGLGLVWAALRWVVPFLLPFLAAFGLAWCLRRPVRALAASAGISRRPAAGLLLGLLAAAVLGGLGYLAARLLVLAGLVLGRLPDLFTGQVLPALQAAAQRLLGGAGQGNAVTAALTAALTDAVAALCTGLAAWAAAAVGRLPALLVPVAFAAVATVYAALDYDLLAGLAAKALGRQRCARLQKIKARSFAVLAKLLRAYFLLFCLTAVQLAAGFLLLRVPNALSLAVLVALVDSLPILGVGTVLLPWAAVCGLTGRSALALGLLVLYLVIWLVRQLCEPRLVGAQLGLHPLASLFFLYAGLRLGGLLGALTVPCAATLVWQLYRERAAFTPAAAPAASPEPPSAAP